VAYGRGLQSTRAADSMEELRAAGLQPTAETYSALVFAYGNDGKQDMVKLTKDEMRDNGLRPSY
jgi:pentatricopeptide repeat protein